MAVRRVQGMGPAPPGCQSPPPQPNPGYSPYVLVREILLFAKGMGTCFQARGPVHVNRYASRIQNVPGAAAAPGAAPLRSCASVRVGRDAVNHVVSVRLHVLEVRLLETVEQNK